MKASCQARVPQMGRIKFVAGPIIEFFPSTLFSQLKTVAVGMPSMNLSSRYPMHVGMNLKGGSTGQMKWAPTIFRTVWFHS